MSEQNDVEVIVVPDIPKTVSNEQIYVYVPAATHYKKGIAAFDIESLNIDNGTVSVNDKYILSIFNTKRFEDFFIKGGNGINVESDYDSKTVTVSISDETQARIDDADERALNSISGINDVEVLSADYDAGFIINKTAQIATPTVNYSIHKKDILPIIFDAEDFDLTNRKTDYYIASKLPLKSGVGLNAVQQTQATAGHSNSAAFGLGTKTARNNQLVVGTFNNTNTSLNDLFSVGSGGSENTRTTAFGVRTDGTVYFRYSLIAYSSDIPLNTNKGGQSIVAGVGNSNSAGQSIVSGVDNTNSGGQSIVSGGQNSNSANGQYSLVAGANSLNERFYSCVIGYVCHNTGAAAAVFGNYNTNSYDHKLVGGRFNNNKSDTLFEIGNGENSERSNAFEAHIDGRASVYGAPVNDEDVVRLKEYNEIFSTEHTFTANQIFENSKSLTFQSTVDPTSGNSATKTINPYQIGGCLWPKSSSGYVATIPFPAHSVDCIVYYDSTNSPQWKPLSDFTIIQTKTLFGNQSIQGEGNIDLYEHDIVIIGTNIAAYLTCYSSKNTKVDSLTDLKTLCGSTFTKSCTGAVNGIAVMAITESKLLKVDGTEQLLTDVTFIDTVTTI